MANMNLNEKTVIELRKLAKELKVPLGAGISKQGIIDKLSMAMAERGAEAPVAEEAPVSAAPVEPAEAPAEEKAEAAEAPAASEPTPAPAFRQAYVAPPRFNNKPAYQAPSYNRQGGIRPAVPAEAPRTQTTRPVGFSSRFGPAATADSAHDEENRSARPESPRPAYGADRRPAYNDANRFRPAADAPRQPSYEQRPSYDQPRQTSYEQRPSYDQPRPSSYEQRPSYDQPRQANYEQRSSYDRPSYDRPAYDSPRPAAPRQGYNAADAAPVYSANPSVSELLADTDAPEGSGVLEIMPEGYGFLRGETLISSARDVYVAAAPIRRFGLRTGDRLTGKCRPQRDGDKYPALLTVGSVNGEKPDALQNRPAFDSLTPIYPTRRINLESSSGRPTSNLRLLDLVTPIGFGQRSLIQCAPHTGKTRLLQRLANVIGENHPEAAVMVLLYNETPEDVTVFREQVTCPVLATTFDMPPENHLRLTDLALEQAQRLVEMKRDVVLLVDSLTTLTKVASTTALQQGRVVPGMVNPASLQKAKRLFGAARCLREGGSLTVIATMSTDNGSKVDDSIINEFRAAANMELVLDQSLARAGVNPPIALALSGTKRAEAILTPAHVEGLKLIRGMLSNLTPANAVQELKSMMEKAATNENLLARIKDWAAAMKA